jgi:hypothetical protein
MYNPMKQCLRTLQDEEAYTILCYQCTTLVRRIHLRTSSSPQTADALSEFETLMENIEQSRHTFTPRNTLEIEVLNLQAQFLSRLSEFFLNIYARFEDLDDLFCDSGIGLCFCDVLRTLLLQQWRSQAMELRALEEITLRRSA